MHVSDEKKSEKGAQGNDQNQKPHDDLEEVNLLRKRNICSAVYRQYKALIKKNYITWKRSFIASLIELILPMIFMYILVYIRKRLIIHTLKFQTDSLLKYGNMIQPIIDPLGSGQTLNEAYENFKIDNEPYFNFTGMSVNSGTMLHRMSVTRCGHTPDNQERAYFATAPKSNEIAASIGRDLELFYFIMSNINRAHSGILDNDKNKDGRADYIVRLPAIKHQKPKYFKTAEAFKKYISHPEYERNDTNYPGICFGVTVNQKAKDDIEIKMHFDDTPPLFGETQNLIPDQRNPAVDEYNLVPDQQAMSFYIQQGYVWLQNWAANAALRQATGEPEASINVAVIPMKSQMLSRDEFTVVLENIFPYFILLMYVMPLYRTIFAMESQIKESMKMMGLSEIAYYLSWMTYYTAIVAIISLLSLMVLQLNVLVYSDPWLVYLFFFAFGLSTFGYATFIQSLFNNPRIASIFGTLIFFGSSFFDILIKEGTIREEVKMFASLFGTVAVFRGTAHLAVFESSQVGLQMSNFNQLYKNMRFAGCINMMLLSCTIFTLVGMYLDQVLIGGYGQKQPWNFLFSTSYWCRKSKQKKVYKDQNIDKNFEISQIKDKNNYEYVEQALNKQETDKKILKIQGLKKTYENGFQAVKGLNLNMYNGQIFALLGHNGAGKTTTISMLTGLIQKSEGLAEIFGFDLFNDMSTIRDFLGVCPQHNILFDMLTPREHFELFCDFKGVEEDEIDDEIEDMIEDLDIVTNQDTLSCHLSGGNKRKLSVGIALIGGSRLVVLDEPTSGLDLSARRLLWNMLKNYKNNRVIILTTHYMDEADILGDRIGIMSNGSIICLGSSLFLKNKFGVGYNLTLVKDGKEENKKIDSYLKQKLGDVKKLSEISQEVCYQIPQNLSHQFKSFFKDFDADLKKLDVRSYGISITTLEEVFLRVGDSDGTLDYQDRQKIKDQLKQSQKKHNDEMDSYTISDITEKNRCMIFFNHMKALFKKRIQIYQRNRKTLFVELIIPILLVLLGLFLSKVKFIYDSPERLLDPHLFPLKQRLLVNEKLVIEGDDPEFDIQPHTIIENLPYYEEAFEATYKDYSGIDISEKQSAIIEQYEKDVYDNRYVSPSRPYRYGSYFIYEANNETKQFKVATFLNLTSQDVAALYPQFMYEAILKVATGNPNFRFKTYTAPFPISDKMKEREVVANGLFIVFVISIGFSLIPASLISHIIGEQENGLKHMQLISGMNLSSYWVSNYIFDLIKSYATISIILILMECFNIHYEYIWLIFLLYPLALIPFTYVCSFILGTENFAQTFTVFMHFSTSGVGVLLIFFLRIMRRTISLGDTALQVMRIFPSFCLTNAILFQSSSEKIFDIRSDLKRNIWLPHNLGGDYRALLTHIVLWNFILILVEANVFEFLKNWYIGYEIQPKEKIELDEDVVEEEDRIQNEPKDQVKIKKLRKVYTACCRRPFLAVERITFGVDFGECFTLLGVNGAGKTTTFKSLTNEVEPTNGEITITGFDVNASFNKVRKSIGFCPQHNAIFNELTVQEHLEYYAVIKGIEENKRQKLIEYAIQELNLESHRDKPAGTLSGGNKRKLCVAVAVLGNPPIILLDEPSTGMDPEARRFMWSVVAKISQQRKKSAVILTTHSMEEAEALSTKMGIMVKGGIFRCFGSSQHIKNKFGTGYEIEVKIQKMTKKEHLELRNKLGFEENKERLSLKNLKQTMKKAEVENFLIESFKIGGLGEELFSEAADDPYGEVSIKNFVNWMNAQYKCLEIITKLVADFEEVEMLENFSDYFKLRVSRHSKSIGYVFGMIEDSKEKFHISEYSVGQTTLEQIFQTFANLEHDEYKNLIFQEQDNGKVEPNTRQQNEDKKNQ